MILKSEAALRRAELASRPIRTSALVAGAWRDIERTFPVIDPTTGETAAFVSDCGETEGREAAAAAAAAFRGWSGATAYERAAILRKWTDLILANLDELAGLMTREMGKPIVESRGEARYAAGFVSFYAEEATRVFGTTIPSQFAHKRLVVNRKPVGPVYAITPWNFPAAMVTRKAAPALAAGCPVILKPAEQTPLTAIRLAELWMAAGGPSGTLQVLPCADPIPVSRVLMEDPRVRKLSFTGSTEVGVRLYAQASGTMKRLSLELGGHAPFLVFGDADVGAAVREVVASKFRNSGQTCVCANRLFVHETVHNEFVDRLSTTVGALTVGDPFDDATQVGPLVDRAALAKVEAHVSDARERGAHVRVGGSAMHGTFFEPTVLTDVRPGMRILAEETFGPVAPIIPFRDEADVVARANDVPYGLAAYLWTSDLSRAHRVAERLEYGIIGVNDGVPSTPQAPFGGVKYSGLGREGGQWGIAEYLDDQFISIALKLDE